MTIGSETAARLSIDLALTHSLNLRFWRKKTKATMMPWFSPLCRSIIFLLISVNYFVKTVSFSSGWIWIKCFQHCFFVHIASQTHSLSTLRFSRVHLIYFAQTESKDCIGASSDSESRSFTHLIQYAFSSAILSLERNTLCSHKGEKLTFWMVSG